MSLFDPHLESHLESAEKSANLDRMLVFNLVRTQNQLNPLLDADLKTFNITAAQFNTLLLLHSSGDTGMLMSEIGTRLVVTKANVTGLVDRLEKLDFVTRTDAPDRRATIVLLTQKGEEIIAKTMPSHDKILAELTECLTANEKQTLINLLSKLRRELRNRRTGGK